MRILRRAAEDTSGVVAIICGLAFLPLMVFIGFCVDYANASRVQTTLQATLDAGLLSAAQNFEEMGPEGDQRRAKIDQRLAAFLRGSGLPQDVVDSIDVKSTITEESVEANATASVPTYIMNVVGFATMPVKARAAVVVANDAPIELALALDVTDSMVNDMGTLRTGAQNFVNQLTGGATNPNVKIGVVPFVGAVNIGNPPGRAAWIDSLGASRHHGQNLRGSWVAMKIMPGCAAHDGDGGIGGGSETDTRGWIDLSDINGMVAGVIRELFGVTAALAYDLREVPAGWTPDSHCYWMNPEAINHKDLFALTPGAVWKGCVEARPEPYDVTDTPPSAGNADTLFVPYFWPDGVDPGVEGYTETYNNYMADEPFPPNTNMAKHGWGRFYSVAKYRLDNPTNISESGADMKGPNRACPEPLLPLTTSYSAISAKISSLRHYVGSGTITSEGLAWAWRVLSPNAPFTEGAPYGEIRKVIVLISDGANRMTTERVAPGEPARFTQYSAYGSLTFGRIADAVGDATSIPKANEYLDQRMSQVCTNIKAAEVEIFVIAFGVEHQQARDLLAACATSAEHFVAVSRSSDLMLPLNKVASKLSNLRLTR